MYVLHCHVSLQATPDHFVLVGLSAPTYKRIGEVSPGDVMWVAHSAASASLAPATVVDVGRVAKEGLYAPLTLGGSILVNGVAASVHR
jgi:2C-methyl-D-erythritol 2,4-cyclodiphosphate synthase